MVSKKIKICFLADKHDLYDDRIYWKMAVPLKNMGYEVYYLLIGDQNKKGVTHDGIYFEILKVNTFSKKRYINFILKRLNPNNNYKLLYRKAAMIEADIYHFHDLWINRIGGKLKRLKHNPVVFYDAREPHSLDYKSLFKSKGIIGKVNTLFSIYVDKWEKYNAKRYDLVIATEDTVRDDFRRKLAHESAVTIFNYSNFQISKTSIPLKEKEYDFIYCGGITKSRGAMNILKATNISMKTNPLIKVVFVGKYSPSNLKNEMQEYIDNNNLGNNVYLQSFVKYAEVENFYNKSKVGLLTWLPLEALTIKMPIKVFEYMAFGLPIIGSDFGHIKSYIEKDNCGITVDPLNSEDISKAMIKLLTNDELYEKYSKNGREATLKKYKWEFEFERLVGFYNKSLNKREY